MAQGFKLVLRPSKPGEKDSEKKFYAVSKTNGTSSMKTLCKLISARSTVSSADVKAVLDNLNFVLDMELQEEQNILFVQCPQTPFCPASNRTSQMTMSRYQIPTGKHKITFFQQFFRQTINFRFT